MGSYSILNILLFDISNLPEESEGHPLRQRTELRNKLSPPIMADSHGPSKTTEFPSLKDRIAIYRHLPAGRCSVGRIDHLPRASQTPSGIAKLNVLKISYLCRLNLLSRGLVGKLIWLHAATYANGVGRIENGRRR